MSDPFASARLKIDRAKKHIEELQVITSALPNAYTATVEIDPHGGHEVLKHDLRDRDKLIGEIALVIGDAVHNLHCALDHAWLATLDKLLPSAVGKHTKFPIYLTQNDLKAALHGIKVDVASPTLFDFIVNKIKPYGGGDDFLWIVHSLDMDDKHRLILPVFEFSSIQGIEVENEQGQVENGFTWGTPEKPPYYVHIPLGWHFKQKGRVSAAVLFVEGAFLQFADTLDMLYAFQVKVWNVVQLLADFVLAEIGRRALEG